MLWTSEHSSSATVVAPNTSDWQVTSRPITCMSSLLVFFLSEKPEPVGVTDFWNSGDDLSAGSVPWYTELEWV